MARKKQEPPTVVADSVFDVPPRPIGRPSSYTPELGERICRLVAGGILLRDLHAMPGMPSDETLRIWRAKYPEFHGAYAHAREESAGAIEGEIRDVTKDVLEGRVEAKAAAVALPYMQWVAEVRNRAVYGKNASLDISARFTSMPDDELVGEMGKLQATIAALTMKDDPAEA